MVTGIEQVLNANPLQKKPLEDINGTLNTLEEWSKKKERGLIDDTEDTEIKRITQDIVSLQIPPAEYASKLNLLPPVERLKVQAMIHAEQANTSQEQYKQYLVASFGQDLPPNVSELARDMVDSTGDMLKLTQEKIAQTGVGENLSLSEKSQKRNAVSVAQAASSASDNLGYQLAQQPEVAKDILRAQGADMSRIMS